MKLLFKNLFAIIFVLVFCFGSTSFTVNAQQMTETQRQTLIAQIAQQITQLKAQIVQISAQQQAGFGAPVLIEIPNINVDAAVVSVGITKDGLMDVPTGHQDAGWFEFGTPPGDIGSAVIDGHVGYWHNGDKTVFNDLNKLKEGDEIYIKDGNGMIITFVVRKISVYSDNENDFNIFNSNDGNAHLNLITCEGVWDGAQETYPNRLVIFADKE